MEEAAEEPEHPREGRAFGALRHRDFRLFWIGSVINQVGAWMQQIAQGWLVYDLTGSPFLVGLSGLFQSVPFIIISLYAGTVIDRVDRRRMLLWISLAYVIATLVLGFLIMAHLVEVWHIYLAGVLNGALGAFESPGRQALLPHLVPRGDLMTAVTLNSVQRKGAQIIGPSLGGILIATLGTGSAYLASAIAFIAPAYCLMAMKTTNPPPETAREPAFQAIMGGLRYVAAERVLLSLILMETAISVLGSYSSMMVVFAREVFDLGAQGLGFLQSAAGFGSVAGSFALASLGDVRHKGRLLFGSGLAYGIALLAFASTPWFSLALPLLGLVGAMDIIFGSTRITLIQLLVRQDMVGRVMSLSAISMRGVGPAGGFISGGLTTMMGSVQLAVGIGAVAVLGVLATTAWRVPLVRNLSASATALADGRPAAPGIQGLPSPSELTRTRG